MTPAEALHQLVNYCLETKRLANRELASDYNAQSARDLLAQRVKQLLYLQAVIERECTDEALGA